MHDLSVAQKWRSCSQVPGAAGDLPTPPRQARLCTDRAKDPPFRE